MKIKDNFVLRKVADTYIVLPLAQACLDFNGMVTLNESGALLWRRMETETTLEKLAEALMEEYTVDREVAMADVDAFVASLKPTGCIEE